MKKTCLKGPAVDYGAHIQSHSLLMWSEHVLDSYQLKTTSPHSLIYSPEGKTYVRNFTRLFKGSLVACSILNAFVDLGQEENYGNKARPH